MAKRLNSLKIYKDVSCLIADDEISILRPLQELLKAVGFQVDIAQSPESALEQLENNTYNLLITDLRFSEGIYGIGITSYATNILRIPVIIMSAYNSRSILGGLAYDHRAVSFLEKPILFAELLDEIKEKIG